MKTHPMKWEKMCGNYISYNVVYVLVTQLGPTLWDPMCYSLPGSCVCGIL